MVINFIDRLGEFENFYIVDKGKIFVYLKWRRFDYDGGSLNLLYYVERRLKGFVDWERVYKGSIKEIYYMVDKCVEN